MGRDYFLQLLVCSMITIRKGYEMSKQIEVQETFKSYLPGVKGLRENKGTRHGTDGKTSFVGIFINTLNPAFQVMVIILVRTRTDAMTMIHDIV